MNAFKRFISWPIYLLLFSGLGYFSYLFLVKPDLLVQGKKLGISPALIVLGFLIMFNILGFVMIQLNSWINRQSFFFFKKKKRVVGYYLVIALLLILLNYTLLTTFKLLMQVPHPLTIYSSGVHLLVTIWLVELVIVSLVMANHSARYALKLYRQKSMLEEESLKARYAALQNQLNPHFLFNSLNVLISEIEYNPQSAMDFTRNLSDVYRYILQCQDQRLASLSDELEFLNAYIFLHQIRLGDCIGLDNRLDKCLYERKIPPLTLQLLVENVIKHNSISLNKPIKIVLDYLPNEEVLVVTHKLRPKMNDLKSGKGLQNLSMRYQLLCSKDILVEKSRTHFTVKLPLLYE